MDDGQLFLGLFVSRTSAGGDHAGDAGICRAKADEICAGDAARNGHHLCGEPLSFPENPCSAKSAVEDGIAWRCGRNMAPHAYPPVNESCIKSVQAPASHRSV